MANRNLLKKFKEYDSTKPQIVKEIAGLLGIPINGSLTVEVPNRNGFVYVRLRNNTNELIQAFNEKVSPVYGLPVRVKWNLNRYEIVSRDTNRYQDWGSFSSFLPRHGSQHSLNFEDGQGGDVTWIYSRQVMPFATVPSGTEGAGTVFVMPHVYRNPTDASWNYIGDESSANFLPAKPTGTSARMMLLVWNLDTGDPLIITGSFLAESSTGTSAILSSVPTITNQNYVPLAAIRLVSGTQSILWDNIYDMRQWAITTPSAFQGGFSVWDEGVPQGTGTVLDFVGGNVQASISGTVVRVYVTGSAGGGTTFSGVDQIGIFGQDEGINQGTGTIFNVTGQRAILSRSGTVLNLNISPDPIELIGVMGWDDGVPKGTGTIIDFGNNLAASLSGTTLRIDTSAGTGSVVVQDDGTTQGSALILNFGSNLTASISGNTAQVDVTNVPAPVNTDGVMAWDEGIPLGTGSVFNFVGSNVDASISGSVVRVFITGSTGGGGRTLIAEVAPAGVSTINLASGIPGTYKLLTFEFAIRSTNASTDVSMDIIFNNDTTDANYRKTVMFGFAVSSTSAEGGANNSTASIISAANSPANSFTVGVAKIPQYANTGFNKHLIAQGSHRRDDSSVFEMVWTLGMEWENTAAITQIDLTLSAGNFADNSVIRLYGES